jgi:hypothetical protein
LKMPGNIKEANRMKGRGRGMGAGGGRGQGQGGRGGQGGQGRGQGQGGLGSQRGGRMGRAGAGQAPGFCVCPQCGQTVEHQPGLPCVERQCPKCGIPLMRQQNQ